ncbi:hypothetical protein Agub_g2281 [Astrephomene gubernaculifera]|uniref:Uncharacterized protein n=1 Tax=Astrephomene gubernaculifera TaxID=47775 RepID=A0AAD3DGT8_9CHLO|nr:hypothetical protein Agub_g2281 [Astrephomene gubernaculifera]
MQNPVLIIATSVAEGSIVACDLKTGAALKSFKGNGSPQNGLCTLGHDYIAAAQTSKHALNFWTWNREQILQRSYVSEAILALTASPDGKYLAGGSSSGTLYLWEVASGRLLRTWAAHYKAATALLFVGGASLLLSGGEDTSVFTWLLPDLLDPSLDPASPAFARPAPLHAWFDHTLPVTALAAGAGEAAAVVASASLDRTVKLRRMADGMLLRSVALPAAVHALALDAGERYLYAAGNDGAVYEVPLLGDPAVSTSGSASNGATNGTAAAAQGNGADGGAYRTLLGHTRPVTSLALASLGPSSSSGGGGGAGGPRGYTSDVLVSGSQDGSVRVWDLGSRQPIQIISAPGKAAVSSILVVPYPWQTLQTGSRSLTGTASEAAAGPSTSSSSGGGKAGPQRLQPLAPLSKFAGTAGSLKRWEGAPVIVTGSETFTGLTSCGGPAGAGGRHGHLLRAGAQLGLPAGFAATGQQLLLTGDGGSWSSGAAATEGAWEAALRGDSFPLLG